MKDHEDFQKDIERAFDAFKAWFAIMWGHALF
jgi:hypothetical protein